MTMTRIMCQIIHRASKHPLPFGHRSSCAAV